METAGLSSLAATIGVGGWYGPHSGVTSCSVLWCCIALTELARNLVTTAIAAGLVDKWGRKPLICFGLLFQMIGLIAVVVGFMGLHSHLNVKPWVILSGIAIFIAGFEGGAQILAPRFFFFVSD